MSILYSLTIGGQNAKKNNVENLINSIKNNSKFDNYQIHIYLEEELYDKKIILYLLSIKKENKHIEIFLKKKWNYSEWIKKTFFSAQNYEYLILVHDDCYFLTKNFDQLFKNEISKYPNIGCFTFVDESYKKGLFAPQLRPGYFIDNIYSDSRDKGIDFELCFQKPYWYKKNIRLKKISNFFNLNSKAESKILNFFFNQKKIFLPKKTAKVHSVFDHVLCLKSNVLKYLKIMPQNEEIYLYFDEDISLEIQLAGLDNAILPDIKYVHDRGNLLGTRSYIQIIASYQAAIKVFYDKWGFSPDWSKIKVEERNSTIKFINKKFGKNISWSKDLYSYDWQYLE